MVKPPLLATAMLLVIAASIAQAQNWTPSDTDIAKLEAGVKLEQLPRWRSNLPPLNGYLRYCAGSTMRGEQVILGEFIVPVGSKQRPGIYLVEGTRKFPMISDGGCAVISLVYSMKQQKIVSIGCNGFA